MISSPRRRDAGTIARRLVLVAFGCLVLTSCDAGTHSVPGLGGVSLSYFPSFETKPMTIQFRPQGSDNNTPVSSANTVVLSRAYVYAVAGYIRPGWVSPPVAISETITKILPDTVYTHGPVKLSISSPGGEAYTLLGRSTDMPTNLDAAAFGGKDRRNIISAELHWAPNGTARNNLRRLRKYYIDGILSSGGRSVAEDGLIHVSATNSPVYYYDPSGDETVTYIHCFNKSNPASFCKYHLALNNNFYVAAEFIDFRFAGGKLFANRRIQAIRNALCPHVLCD
jgi:hypothetical protein